MRFVVFIANKKINFDYFLVLNINLNLQKTINLFIAITLNETYREY